MSKFNREGRAVGNSFRKRKRLSEVNQAGRKHVSFVGEEESPLLATEKQRAVKYKGDAN